MNCMLLILSTVLAAPALPDVVLIKDIGRDTASSNPREFTPLDGQLFFIGVGQDGQGLWRSDGAEAGTVLVQDIFPGPCCSSMVPDGAPEVRRLARFKGTLFFTADDPIHGSELWSCQPEFEEGPFRRGDADANGRVELTDVVAILGAIYQGEVQPSCLDGADFDDGGVIDITDPINILGYLFLGGVPPFAPGPHECGIDTTADTLPRCSYPYRLCD